MYLGLPIGVKPCDKAVWERVTDRVKWKVVCRSKEFGGLGVKDLECFNLSLFGKWVWSLLDGSNAF